jgi:hypothetical protein
MTETKSVDSSKFVESLIKAKAQFGKVLKNKTNPFHKSKYADLDSINAAVDAALLANGLFIIQTIEQKEDKSFLVAKILHTSGYYDPGVQSSSYPLPDDLNPQKMGSALTYGRRYNLSALLGLVADADDDGNISTKVNNSQLKVLKGIVSEAKWASEDVIALLKSRGFSKSDQLDLISYQEICDYIKQNPKQ